MTRKARFNTLAAVRGSFSTSSEESGKSTWDWVEVPGRKLAELVSDGLRKRGLDVGPVVYQEPFFTTKCCVGGYTYEVESFIYIPDQRDPIWVVNCPPTLNFVQRLFGKSERRELGAVLSAINDTLKSDSRVTGIRWFKRLPGNPFRTRKYWTSPFPGD